MIHDEVVAMLVIHVDDITIAAIEEITYLVVADLSKRFPTKHAGEVMWYMGSEYKGIGRRVHWRMCRLSLSKMTSNVSV